MCSRCALNKSCWLSGAFAIINASLKLQENWRFWTFSCNLAHFFRTQAAIRKKVKLFFRDDYIEKEQRPTIQNDKKEEDKYRASCCYAAEYRDLDGKQVCRNLGTNSKAKARRIAMEIQQQLETGIERAPEINLLITDLVDKYLNAVKVKGVAKKTELKYKADSNKLKYYCSENNI